MPISRANGLDIYYETCGSGPPIVLIHALPFDHHLWLYQVARFSSRLRTVAMDLRGLGRSAKTRTPFTFADMGNDILGVLTDEGITGGAIVAGCSIGSKLALMLACDHPGMFRAAILIGGNSGPQPQLEHRIAAYRAAAAAGALGTSPSGMLVPKARALMAAALSAWAAAFEAIVELRLWPSSGTSRGSMISAATQAAAGAATHTRGDANTMRSGRNCTSAQINATLPIWMTELCTSYCCRP